MKKKKKEIVLTRHNAFHLQKAFKPNYTLTPPHKMICNYYLCCTTGKVIGQQLTPEWSRFPVFCLDHNPLLFLHHTLSLNSPECIDFACFTAALSSSSLGSPWFPCPWVLLLETFTFFPLNKPSIVLWVTTHLLSVYRNNQLLSKMNSQRSEDSAEALLLSG